MQRKQTEIITIERLRKNGSLNQEIIEKIKDSLINGKIVVMPTDGAYGIIYLESSDIPKKISSLLEKTKRVRLISSFKMLGEIAEINKFDYDFLNRIWPGEVTVVLKSKQEDKAVPNENQIVIRFPRAKFLQNVIDVVNKPMILSNAITDREIPIFKKGEIIKAFKDSVDLIIIVNELCRKYHICSVVDISTGSLEIIQEGKISSEEIRSLYFLGKDDDLEY